MKVGLVSARHLIALLNVAELYMRCLNEDPENENLTLPESMMVSELTDAIKAARKSLFPEEATE